jgi:acetyl esterase/lipase
MIPELDPVSQAEEIADDIVFAQKQAKGWGGDPNKFILIGHSAGAHLVAFLNANPVRAYNKGALPWLGVVSLDSGALDVTEIMQKKHFRLYDKAFGDKPD